MAFIKNAPDEGEPEVQTGTNTRTNQQSNQTPPGQKAPTARSFTSIVDEFDLEGSLSQDALKYITSIRAILEDPTSQFKVATVKLGMENCFMFKHNDNHSVVLIFNDIMMPDIYSVGRNELVVSAIMAAKKADTTTNVLNAIVVTKHDYEKHNQMADYILSALRVYATGDVSVINLASFNSESIAIETNIDVVQNYIKSRDPSGIPARCDIGFICYKQQQNSLMGGGGRNDQHNASKKPLFAVSGYTEFVPDTTIGGKVKFTPVVHISNIVTRLLFPGIIPLAISVAAEVFLSWQVWQLPYKRIKKGSVNIGNLAIDGKDGKPKMVTNEKELNYMFMEQMTAPALVLDVVEGRPRIPALAMFNPGSANELSDLFKKFLCIESDGHLDVLNTSQMIASLIGTCQASNIVPNTDTIDTRYIDYLNVVNQIGYDDITATLFMKYGLDILKKTEIIKAVTSESDFTNLCNEMQIDGGFLQMVVENIAQFVKIINPMNDGIRRVDIQGLNRSTYSAQSIMATRGGGMNVPRSYNYQNLY